MATTTGTSPPYPESLQLVSKAIGPLPSLNRLLERLEIERFLADLVRAGDRRQRLAPAVGLGVLLRNFLFARQPSMGWPSGPTASSRLCSA
jgi:hypothetical protein